LAHVYEIRKLPAIVTRNDANQIVNFHHIQSSNQDIESFGMS